MWQADVPFRPSAHWVNLALGGDVLCVQGATEMFALSTSDGTQLWKFNDGNTGGINGVAVGQDAVYFSNITNPPGLPKIYALQSGTGKVIWTTLLSGDGVALADGAVYVGAEYINTVNLYALSAADGAQIWEIPVDVFSTPVVKNGVVYTLAGLNPPYMFYALQASNGKQLWSSPVPWFDGEIVTDGNTVCALFSGTATSGGALWAWRASDGKELWKSDANNGFFSAAIAGDVVYAVNDDGELLALNAGDGTKIWGYPASPSAVPAISNGLVYAIGAGGGLVALHASNGTPVWHSSIYSTAGPVVGADAVYASDNSRVYALRT